MESITYLMKESHMDYFAILKLPYAIFHSLLKHFYIFNICQTPEGYKAYERSKRLEQTEPDFNKIRAQNGYRKGGEE